MDEEERALVCGRGMILLAAVIGSAVLAARLTEVSPAALVAGLLAAALR
jgi:hypothetical protein